MKVIQVKVRTNTFRNTIRLLFIFLFALALLYGWVGVVSAEDVVDLGTSGVPNNGTLIGNTSISTDAKLGSGALRSMAATGAPETTRLSVGGDLTDLDMTSSYTYMAWVKILFEGEQGIIGLGACCDPPLDGNELRAREGYTLNYQGNGELRFWGGSSNADDNFNLNTDENVLNLNQYHHVAVRVQPGNVQIFFDGVSVATDIESNIPTSPSKVNQNNIDTPGAPSIGGPKVDNGNTADMLIDEVRVYGRALSDMEIATIAAGNIGPLPDRLYYNFEPIKPIPTLSEWGLIAMAGVLGIIGFMVMRRRKVTA